MRVEEVSHRLLKFLAGKSGRGLLEEACSTLNLNPSPAMRAILTLEREGLVKVHQREVKLFKLTPEGLEYASAGLPERRMVEAISRLGGSASLNEALVEAGIPEDKANIALGWLVRKGWGKIVKRPGSLLVEASPSPPEGLDEKLLRLLAKTGEADLDRIKAEGLLEAAQQLKHRNLLEEKAKSLWEVELTERGWERVEKLPEALEVKPEVTLLSRELLQTGRWREVTFRRYDVTARPPTLHPGKKHFYLEFLEEVREVLLAMGFEEAWGPYVETEFWNFDALFQPQDHPAREIHDSYQLKHPQKGRLPGGNLASAVKQTHENGWKTGSKGWRYRWNPEVARRLVLRTQTTAVSVRYLASHQKPPIKMFCLSKVFRPDVLDAKHSMEFHQCDGIMGDWGLNLRHLLGFFEEFCGKLGFKEVKFTPSYFPFTEPSVEVFVKHPRLGWVEIAGSGVFRPEVTYPLGVKFPVLAWGMGIGRLAMVRLGIDDIRELHTRRLTMIRGFKV
ncbi:MAG: phenylalanine--tRNA ligase subunit alpha [Candidatus Hecatellaceae archaeon]